MKNSEGRISEFSDLSGNKKTIGPTLPPHLRNDTKKQEDIIGPALPPGMDLTKNESSDEESIGPKLPSHLRNKRDNSTSESYDIGPQLPPSSVKASHTIGPSLPPGIINKKVYSDINEEDDNDIIGPLPCEMLKGDDSFHTAAEIEARARQMRNKLEGKEEKEEKISRESWMMELPSSKLSQSIGLQARSFRAKAGPDMSDRSAWTDTPADRERKEKEQDVGKKRRHDDTGTSERDKILSKDVKKYNKSNRPESLLELHQKELKKKKPKTEDKPADRRPFDRELDLQVNKFDDAQRKAIIKKSQKLDSRFSHGDSQFL